MPREPDLMIIKGKGDLHVYHVIKHLIFECVYCEEYIVYNEK